MRMACCITAILLVLLLVPPGQGYPRTADQPLPVAAPPLAERQDRPAASDQDPIVCILCTDLLHLVIELFNDSWIQKATEEVEERLCPLLPTEEEIKQCKIAVHVFGHQVYDVISKWMNPRKLCQEIALCPATSSEKLHKEQSMAFSKDLKSFSGTLPAAPPHFMRQLPTLCDLCKYIVQDVQNLLTSNMTECMIHTSGQSLPRRDASTEVIGVPVSTRGSSMTATPRDPQGRTGRTSGSTILCLLCVDVVDQTKQAVKDPDLQKNVKDGFMNGVCALFKYNEGSKCREKVKVYAPLVFDLIQNSLDPKTFCQDVSLCGSDTLVPPTPVPVLQSAVLPFSIYMSLPGTAGSSSLSCDLCLFLVHEVVNRLTSNTTEDELIKMVDRVCLVLPTSMEKPCFEFVYDFLTTVMKMVVDGLIRPQQVCSSLHLCPPKGSKALPYKTSKAAQDNQHMKDKDQVLRFQPLTQK